jgi:hypothetical protein
MAGGLALFLALLPFHLVVKRLIPGPLGTYWKEALLGLLLVLWAIRCLRARRLLLTGTPLDGAVLFYLAILVLRYLLDGAGWVGAWGLYISVLYLPLFWLVPTLLRRCPAWTTRLLCLMVGVGAIVALGGILEFALDTPLWPSDEAVVRQGFPSVFIYGTHIRRVYFTFDSPTTLANTLAMLLPLALALGMNARSPWGAVAAWLAAALMGICIVLTFSRGIWVATILALLVMGILSGFVRRRWRLLVLVAGVLLVIAMAWGLAAGLWPGPAPSTYAGVVELSPEAYANAPVRAIHQEILSATPLLGEAITTIWTLRDPITARDDERQILYQHPPENGQEPAPGPAKGEIIYAIDVPQDGALRFAIAIAPETWTPAMGDGVTFQLFISEPGTPQEGEPIFVRYINPKHNPSDRRWRNYLVDLAPWAGRTVHLSLSTGPGPAGDWRFDWAGWADLQVLRVEPGYFASMPTEGAILRHTRSIGDWARDETNRDRLAAWSQAWNAWRAAPLWGQGLGTTGAAALRTQPRRAFVTESQILKAVVELGPLGLLALAYLWFQIARAGYRAYRTVPEPVHNTLLLGIFTSLLIVFVEGLVYQNLEVKQVNAYFWTLTGVLAFLAGQASRPGRWPL